MSKEKQKKQIVHYHFENYIQMQKLNCILKIICNNEELTPGPKKSRQSIRLNKNGPL